MDTENASVAVFLASSPTARFGGGDVVRWPASLAQQRLGCQKKAAVPPYLKQSSAFLGDDDGTADDCAGGGGGDDHLRERWLRRPRLLLH